MHTRFFVPLGSDFDLEFGKHPCLIRSLWRAKSWKTQLHSSGISLNKSAYYYVCCGMFSGV